jgi:hypothetical protein
MTDSHTIVEAYCIQCDRVWSSKVYHKPERVAKAHADQTGHTVRVTVVVVKVYNREVTK